MPVRDDCALEFKKWGYVPHVLTTQSSLRGSSSLEEEIVSTVEASVHFTEGGEPTGGSGSYEALERVSSRRGQHNQGGLSLWVEDLQMDLSAPWGRISRARELLLPENSTLPNPGREQHENQGEIYNQFSLSLIDHFCKKVLWREVTRATSPVEREINTIWQPNPFGIHSIATSQNSRLQVAPMLYLPYPMMVEILCRFESGAFWFQDHIVLVDGELIAGITKLPMECTTTDLKEEAKGVDKDWISGRPFLVPSLVATICMETLGLAAWIEPTSYPQLYLYARMQIRKGEEKDQNAMTYLGYFHTSLQNDGLERSKKVPEYIKKQWRELQWMEDDKMTYASLRFKEKDWANSNPQPPRLLVVDHSLTSPMAQYNYWTSNKAHFTEETYGLTWLPPNLPMITYPEPPEKSTCSWKREGEVVFLDLATIEMQQSRVSILNPKSFPQGEERRTSGANK
eukprot:Gb_08086 [translate_table: standard]